MPIITSVGMQSVLEENQVLLQIFSRYAYYLVNNFFEFRPSF